MWYGKLAVICFVFSFSLLFSTWELNQVIQDPTINQSATYKSLSDITATFNPKVSPTPTLIFGDFISAFKLLSDLMTGGVFNLVFGGNGVLTGTQYYGVGLQLLMGLMFDSSALFFILYIISNRSI